MSARDTYSHAGEVSYYLAQSLNQARARQPDGRTRRDLSIHLSLCVGSAVTAEQNKYVSQLELRLMKSERSRNPPSHLRVWQPRPTKEGRVASFSPRITLVTLAAFKWTFIHFIWHPARSSAK